jgi:hypothetical protein
MGICANLFRSTTSDERRKKFSNNVMLNTFLKPSLKFLNKDTVQPSEGSPYAAPMSRKAQKLLSIPANIRLG